MFGLSYLSPENVGDCFAISFSEIQPTSEKLTKFTDYLVENYISEDSLFPPYIWAEKSASTQRTTNACESFHSKFNSSFYSSHPNLFQFIEVLKDFQKDIYIKLNSITCKKVLRKALQNKAEFIQRRINELDEGVLSPFDFVKTVCFKNLPVSL